MGSVRWGVSGRVLQEAPELWAGAVRQAVRPDGMQARVVGTSGSKREEPRSEMQHGGWSIRTTRSNG